MARTAGKKQAPAKVEDDDDAEGWEDAVVEADDKDGGADLRLRDWRDVERFREMKDLRRLVDDDYGLEEIFHVPMKPRADAAPRTSPKLVMPAKLLPAPEPRPNPKPAAKVATAAKKAPAKAHTKAKPTKAKPKVKAKAKKR